ncbi:MAG: beta-Ala-His dipeptidase, partial [Fusobacteriaceae bacterium]
MSVLRNLQPQKVMYYFQEISSIPRASKNEKEISNWLVNWAKVRKFSVIQDEFLNIIIKKPASTGYESIPTLIIQGHMDMVCEKNSNTSHDFSNEGINLQVQGDLIKGTGTTLGADNGIAVAFALALLDSDLPHPALEVLITSDEEMGMTGALNLDGSLLTGKLMINLDTEEEGEIYVSCAGGARGEFEIPVHWDILPELSPGYLLKVRGLQGGHSGADIHEQRANANKLLGRVLKELSKSIFYSVGHIHGGAKDNAIPRESEAALFINKDDVNKLQDTIKKMEDIFKDEYRQSDSEIRLEVEKVILSKVMDNASFKKVLDAITLHPDGINTWSLDIANLVESSLNLGVIIQNENSILLKSAIRGSVESRKFEIIHNLETLS